MTIAGSKGGMWGNPYDPVGFENEVVKIWAEIGQKKCSGTEVYDRISDFAYPAQVEIGIGNTCGLKCKHCFLGYEGGSMQSDLIPVPRLKSLLSEFIEDMGTRVICLTDRDALTPGRSVPVFEHLAQLRQRYPDLKFGGVTNGLAIPEFADDLAKIRLDYLDISLDGMRPEHDAIRGEGAFDMTIKNLRIALSKKIAERVIIATTLSRFNHQSIVGMVKKLIVEEGVQWFDIAPLMAVKMDKYQLGETDMVSFLEDLSKTLKAVDAQRDVTIFFEMCAYCAAYFPGLIDHGWLKPEDIRQDKYGHLYQDIRINDRITISLRLELIPEYWWHKLRISADGYIIGGCEPLSQGDYHRFAVGNVKEGSAKELYASALAVGSPFHEMMKAYDTSGCRDKECFEHCLGGDSLLSKSLFDSYNRKDPSCTWDGYHYKNIKREVVYA